MPSRRCQAALVHEILHGKLLVDGYPWLNTDAGGNPIHDLLPNVVHHELTIGQYLELDLPQEDFVILSKPNYPAESLYDDDPTYGYWQWLCQWRDWELVRNEESKEAAEWLRNYTEEDTDTYDRLIAWFDTAHFIKPDGLEAAYSELSCIMKMSQPVMKQWFRLKAGSPFPIVVPSA